MPECHFVGYCDRQNMVNSKQCLCKEGECNFQIAPPKVIILDDNPYSIMCYLEEYGDKLQTSKSKEMQKT